MMKSIGYAVLAAAAVAFAPSSGEAQVGSGECLINFDDSATLSNIYAQARDTFALNTRASSSEGRLEACDRGDVGCWIYRQRCARNYVHVDEVPGYNHIHLSFSAPGFDGTCGFHEPGDGYPAGMRKKVNGQCVNPDWVREPRLVNTHWTDHWVRIEMEDQYTREPTLFAMQTIRLGDTGPVQLWFHNSRDEWWYWDELAPNWWDVSRWMQDVDGVYARTADGYDSVISIEDFHLRDFSD